MTHAETIRMVTEYIAIGWVTGAIESDHPGYLLNQAELAEQRGNSDIAAVLREWHRLAQNRVGLPRPQTRNGPPRG